MSGFIAALPMYDWPETREQTDTEWDRFRDFFGSAGIDAPQRLVRRNGELPPVPGGIRDAAGTVIAPDPATLPPDELDFHAVWLHPQLLLAQTCWGPMELGLRDHVVVVGQPSYRGIAGGEGEFYSSPIVMRRDSEDAGVPETAAPPPAGGEMLLPLDLMRGKRFAFNGLDSMSGIIALTRDLEAVGETLDLFSDRIVSGAHRASIAMVADGRADVAAIDCRSWKLAQRHEPAAKDVVVVGWTAWRKGLPMITSRHTPPEIVATMREILSPK